MLHYDPNAMRTFCKTLVFVLHEIVFVRFDDVTTRWQWLRYSENIFCCSPNLCTMSVVLYVGVTLSVLVYCVIIARSFRNAWIVQKRMSVFSVCHHCLLYECLLWMERSVPANTISMMLLSGRDCDALLCSAVLDL